MRNRYLAGLMLAGILAFPLSAQMPEGYLEVYIAKVKAGKRAEFDTINKRMVTINKKNNGDTWLALEVMYGEQNTVYFTSTRNTFGAAEEASKAFMGAATKALGAAGMQKLFNDFDSTVENARSELRRRRWDLTASAPADAAAYAKMIAQSRFVRTAIVRVRPGKAGEYEDQLKMVKSAQERANPGVGVFVSQVVAGEPTGVFYITTLVKSLSDLDKVKPLQEVLGSSWAGYQRAVAESVASTEVFIGRFLPELSNPPEEVASLDAKYWRPAPPPPPPAKPAEAKK